MVKLRYNPTTGRFDCYQNGEYITTLTCGDRFTMYADDEDAYYNGHIEHHIDNGYYFTDISGDYVLYLYSGLEGMIDNEKMVY